MTLAVFEPDSAALTARLGNASERFAALVAAADQRSGRFIRKFSENPWDAKLLYSASSTLWPKRVMWLLQKYSQAFDGNALAPGQLRFLRKPLSRRGTLSALSFARL